MVVHELVSGSVFEEHCTGDRTTTTTTNRTSTSTSTSTSGQTGEKTGKDLDDEVPPPPPNPNPNPNPLPFVCVVAFLPAIWNTTAATRQASIHHLQAAAARARGPALHDVVVPFFWTSSSDQTDVLSDLTTTTTTTTTVIVAVNPRKGTYRVYYGPTQEDEVLAFVRPLNKASGVGVGSMRPLPYHKDRMVDVDVDVDVDAATATAKLVERLRDVPKWDGLDYVDPDAEEEGEEEGEEGEEGEEL